MDVVHGCCSSTDGGGESDAESEEEESDEELLDDEELAEDWEIESVRMMDATGTGDSRLIQRVAYRSQKKKRRKMTSER